MKNKLKVAAVATIGAIVSFAPSYFLADRVLIAYWEWQHGPMKITFWADERALAVALGICAFVFYGVYRRFQRRLPSNEQISRRVLGLSLIAAMVVLYVGIAAYEIHSIRIAVQSSPWSGAVQGGGERSIARR